MGILDGKVALITGGGTGVGQGCAYALAREGAAVAITGRTERTLRETVEYIEDFGGRAIAIVADATVESDVNRSIDETVAAFGGLDFMVNNAVGKVFIGPLLEASIQDLQAELDIGPIAALRYMQGVYPHLKARGGGVIINMVTGVITRSDLSLFGLYGGAKATMMCLTRAAAAEWGKDDIRVISVAPVCESPAKREYRAAQGKDVMDPLAMNFLRREGDAEKDIGMGVVALCSPASRYMTGMTIPLDGGQCHFA